MDIKDILKQLKSFLKPKGFIQKGKLFYLIQNEVACCVELEKPTSQIYLAFYILPLYMPLENRCFTYGNRVSFQFLCHNLHGNLKNGNTERFWNSFYNFFDTTILPFFEKVVSPEKLIQICENGSVRNFFDCTDVDIIRLHYITSAFLGDDVNLVNLAETYFNRITAAVYYTDTVKSNYYREIEFIHSISQLENQARKDYYNQRIHQSLEKCFGFKAGDGLRDKGTVCVNPNKK